MRGVDRREHALPLAAPHPLFPAVAADPLEVDRPVEHAEELRVRVGVQRDALARRRLDHERPLQRRERVLHFRTDDTRPNKREVTLECNTAVTGKDREYEIRGAHKHTGHMAE